MTCAACHRPTPTADLHRCPDLGALCPDCYDAHAERVDVDAWVPCRACADEAREDAAAERAEARRKGEW